MQKVIAHRQPLAQAPSARLPCLSLTHLRRVSQWARNSPPPLRRFIDPAGWPPARPRFAAAAGPPLVAYRWWSGPRLLPCHHPCWGPPYAARRISAAVLSGLQCWCPLLLGAFAPVQFPSWDNPPPAEGMGCRWACPAAASLLISVRRPDRLCCWSPCVPLAQRLGSLLRSHLVPAALAVGSNVRSCCGGRGWHQPQRRLARSGPAPGPRAGHALGRCVRGCLGPLLKYSPIALPAGLDATIDEAWGPCGQALAASSGGGSTAARRVATACSRHCFQRRLRTTCVCSDIFVFSRCRASRHPAHGSLTGSPSRGIRRWLEHQLEPKAGPERFRGSGALPPSARSTHHEGRRWWRVDP